MVHVRHLTRSFPNLSHTNRCAHACTDRKSILADKRQRVQKQCMVTRVSIVTAKCTQRLGVHTVIILHLSSRVRSKHLTFLPPETQLQCQQQRHQTPLSLHPSLPEVSLSHTHRKRVHSAGFARATEQHRLQQLLCPSFRAVLQHVTPALSCIVSTEHSCVLPCSTFIKSSNSKKDGEKRVFCNQRSLQSGDRTVWAPFTHTCGRSGTQGELLCDIQMEQNNFTAFIYTTSRRTLQSPNRLSLHCALHICST